MPVTERQKRYYASEKGKAKKSPYTEEARKAVRMLDERTGPNYFLFYDENGEPYRAEALQRRGWWKTRFGENGPFVLYTSNSVVLPKSDTNRFIKAAEAFAIVEAARKAIWKK